MKYLIMVGLLAGCGAIELTGTPMGGVDANDTNSLELSFAPDVSDHEPDAPVPDCGDCMATSCSDCLRWCDGACVSINRTNCVNCGTECADGQVCQGVELGGVCRFECVDG